MKFVFASDSFKGSLSSYQIAKLLDRTAKRIFPDCETVSVGIADGGEGTAETIVKTVNGHMRSVRVLNPLGEEVEASYGELPGKKVIVEMAAASGITLILPNSRNPLFTTTFGTGQLLKDALEQGFRDITIAIGGSATNDGGMGALRALGVKFLDQYGKELSGTGSDLINVAEIDCSDIHSAVRDTKFTVICDVTNPLTGPEGATYTFGRQKGADDEILEELEKGMKNYAAVIKKQFGIDCDTLSGAGAAGGLGAACMVFLKAECRSGIETVLELVHFEDLIRDADYIITGEGRVDWQSAFGKVLWGIGRYGKKHNIPVIAITGSLGDGAEKVYDCGITSVMTTVNGIMTIEDAMEHAEQLYLNAAERMFRMLRI